MKTLNTNLNNITIQNNSVELEFYITVEDYTCKISVTFFKGTLETFQEVTESACGHYLVELSENDEVLIEELTLYLAKPTTSFEDFVEKVSNLVDSHKVYDHRTETSEKVNIEDIDLSRATDKAKDFIKNVVFGCQNGKVSFEEPCDCGSRIRHNNGGNYHDWAVFTISGSMMKATHGSTSEYKENRSYCFTSVRSFCESIIEASQME